MVDASQGVEAQTLANVYQAIDANLEIVPVLNKVDLPAAEPERVAPADRGCDRHRRLRRRADFGQDRPGHRRGARSHRHPPARRRRATRNAPLKALLVDSWYDAYLGVVVLVRVIDGELQARASRCKLMATDGVYQVDRVGVFTPKKEMRRRAWAPARSASSPPQIKQVADTHVGDTITDERNATAEAAARLQAGAAGGVLPASSRSMPPISKTCAKRMGQLHLNDASFSYEMETSAALGLRFPLRLPRASCISKSSASGSSANSMSTSSPRRRRVIYKLNMTRRHA